LQGFIGLSEGGFTEVRLQLLAGGGVFSLERRVGGGGFAAGDEMVSSDHDVGESGGLES
jgi:hypothetical protein